MEKNQRQVAISSRGKGKVVNNIVEDFTIIEYDFVLTEEELDYQKRLERDSKIDKILNGK